MAQLVEQGTRIVEVMGFNPVAALKTKYDFRLKSNFVKKRSQREHYQ